MVLQRKYGRKVSKARRYLLLFLGAKDKKIDSVFKFEMLIFMLSQTDPKLDKLFNFKKSASGPHSFVFHLALKSLIKEGLIKLEHKVGVDDFEQAFS